VNVELIVVPFDSGMRDVRMGRGPGRLLEAGIVEALEQGGGKVRVIRAEPAEGTFPSEVGMAFELQRVIARHVAAARKAGAFPLVLAGNCNTAVGTVAGLTGESRPAPLVVWLDAHADFNTPETSQSGFLDGMAVAILTGRCWHALAETVPGFSAVDDESVVLVGMRDPDPAETELLESSGVHCLAAGFQRKDADELIGRSRADLREAYVHVDLDAFDPSEGRANGYAVEGGLTRSQLADLLAAVRGRCAIGGAAITAYDPSCDEDGRVANLAIEAATLLVGGAAE
jgi:arginase